MNRAAIIQTNQMITCGRTCCRNIKFGVVFVLEELKQNAKEEPPNKYGGCKFVIQNNQQSGEQRTAKANDVS
jgi:hypothetical protein